MYYITVTLLLAISTLFAKISQESLPQIDSCYLKRMPTGVPPALQSECNDPNFYASASYTLWTARQEGMSTGVSNSSFIIPVSTTLDEPGKTFYPHWKLRSGFKAEIGGYIGSDSWDLNIEYAWFCNKDNHFSSFIPSTGEIFPSWFTYVIPNVDSAQSKWDNFFNRIDATLGRALYLARTLSVRPFLGVLGAFEKQWFTIQYRNIETPSIINEETKQKWWAIGPYFGSENSFICGRKNSFEWSLFFNNGAALTWGNYKTANQIARSSNQTSFYEKNSLWNFTPVLELALGLRMESFHSTYYKWSSRLEIGWEGQVWFAHNQMAAFNFLRDGNNYSMQGLTATLHFSF